MPREDGSFKGISINKVWPGHRDYDPDDKLEEDVNAWDIVQMILDGETHIPKPKKKRR